MNLISSEAWKAITDRVQDARLSVGMKPVSFVGVNGLYMTGLDHPAVVYLVEQLQGFKRFHNYKFKYHPPQLDEDVGIFWILLCQISCFERIF